MSVFEGALTWEFDKVNRLVTGAKNQWAANGTDFCKSLQEQFLNRNRYPSKQPLMSMASL